MSSSLDHPLTGKSTSIVLAFALHACVRAKLLGLDASAVAGGGQVQFVGLVRPSFGRSNRSRRYQSSLLC